MVATLTTAVTVTLALITTITTTTTTSATTTAITTATATTAITTSTTTTPYSNVTDLTATDQALEFTAVCSLQHRQLPVLSFVFQTLAVSAGIRFRVRNDTAFRRAQWCLLLRYHARQVRHYRWGMLTVSE